MSDDVIIYAADVELLRGMLARALDRSTDEVDRAAARLDLVGALDYLLRERNRTAAKAREQQEWR